VDIKTTFYEWMSYGIEKGWCGPPVCYTHDGLPMSSSEYDEEDLCMHIVRMYEDEEMKEQIEEEHTPSQWRNSYTKQNSVLAKEAEETRRIK
jgi:hypothetical protein